MKKTGFKIALSTGKTAIKYLQPIVALKALAHFRPKGWDGQYGFDWFRDGGKGDNNVDYKELVGYHYKDKACTIKVTNENDWKGIFKKDENLLKSLKETYNPTTEYEFNDEEYYVPKLALFAKTDNITPNNAKLKLYFELDKKNKPDSIEFEIPTGITVDKPIIESPGKSETIEVTCTDSFNDDAFLKAFAIKGDERKEVGKLQIIAPAKKMTQKVVIVKVKTKTTLSGKFTIGKYKKTMLDSAEKYLKQALISLDVSPDIIELDVTDPTKNRENLDFDKQYRKDPKADYIDTTKRDGPPSLDWFLKDKLDKEYLHKYSDYFRLFYIGEECVDPKTYGTGKDAKVKGYSRENGNFAVLFSNVDYETLGHEMLHGFGLEHTFGNNAGFTYKALATRNIMDYSHMAIPEITRYNTWYWQWKIANKNM